MLNFLKRLFRPMSRDRGTNSDEPLSPEAEAWLYTDLDGKRFSADVIAAINGETSSLTSADIDPENSAAYDRYTEACALKLRGDLLGAASLLAAGCKTPNIYSGHYRLLFQLWRQLNRTDIKERRYEPVIDRVTQMVKYDDQMVGALLAYWGERQNRNLPSNHFDGERNLKISDAKALLTAATALSRRDVVTVAKRLIKRF